MLAEPLAWHLLVGKGDAEALKNCLLGSMTGGGQSTVLVSLVVIQKGKSCSTPCGFFRLFCPMLGGCGSALRLRDFSMDSPCAWGPSFHSISHAVVASPGVASAANTISCSPVPEPQAPPSSALWLHVLLPSQFLNICWLSHTLDGILVLRRWCWMLRWGPKPGHLALTSGIAAG